ncbi:hypothetical protein [Chryseobacterium sp. VD8]|uniref:hypothetical protein n=1 Tax=Chryseobacterium sp. VD8 TaxID=3081254 RepID=UPI003017D588
MKIKLTLFTLSVFLLLGCGNNKTNPRTTTENDSILSIAQEETNTINGQSSKPRLVQKSINSTNGTDLEQLKTEASRLNGGGSIKEVKLENGKAIITYVKNYNEYKELNPSSGLTENDLKLYWSTGNEIQKTLVGSPARLMKNLDFINEVKIILPFENKTYQINITKSQLEKFVGKNISKIKNDWTRTFADPYIYNQKGREEFFSKFGTVKSN